MNSNRLLRAAAAALLVCTGAAVTGASVTTADARTLAEMPVDTFLENLVIDRAGRVFVTSHEDGIVYRLDDDSVLTKFAAVPGKVTGLATAERGFVATGADASGKAAIFSIDPAGAVTTTFPIEGAVFLNGIARLDAGRYLVADSFKGAIWLVDVARRRASVWLADPLLARADEAAPFPAANGIKIAGDRVVVSNTAKQLMLSIPLVRGGPGPIRVMVEGVNVDDFAVDRSGAIYAATHIKNSLIRIERDGRATTLAGAAEGMTGSTAVVFRDRGRDRELLVTTNGGMFMPPPEGVQTAKVVQVALPRTTP